MASKKQRLIKEVVDESFWYTLSGSVADLIKRLEDEIREHGSDLRIEVDTYQDYDGCEGKAELYIMRSETSGEEHARLMLEKVRDLQQEKRDRLVLRTLRERYPDEL